MGERGISLAIAEDIYEKILAFSSYGFPESHAISFAYLVYASAWLKCYYPAAFTAALLRAQPMGFYSPASLISDVRRHGVQVRGVDVNASGVLAVLEEPVVRRPEPPAAAAGAGARRGPGPARRSGSACPRCATSARAAAAIVAGQPYADLEDFARRTALPVRRARGTGDGGRVRLLRAVAARGAVGGGGRGHDPAVSCRGRPSA